MGRKTVFFDDISGEQSDTPLEEWTFEFDGKQYKLEVLPQTKDEIHRRIAELLSEGSLSEISHTPASQTEIRAWAKRKGIEVHPQGRISKSVLEKYDATH